MKLKNEMFETVPIFLQIMENDIQLQKKQKMKKKKKRNNLLSSFQACESWYVVREMNMTSR